MTSFTWAGGNERHDPSLADGFVPFQALTELVTSLTEALALTRRGFGELELTFEPSPLPTNILVLAT